MKEGIITERKDADLIKWGEIYLVDFENGKGAETKGINPAIIIQNNIGNKHSPCTNVIPLMPYTKHNKEIEYLFINLPPDKSGLNECLTADITRTTVIAKSRLIRKIGNIDDKKVMDTIIEALAKYLNVTK